MRRHERWRLGVSQLPQLLQLLQLLGAAAADFSCLKESGIFPDPDQCDKYWVSREGHRGYNQLREDGRQIGFTNIG